MKLLFRPSIARRLTGTLLLACAVVWGAIYLLGQYNVRRSESGTFDSDMLSLAGAISRVIAANPGAGGKELVLLLSGIDATLDADLEVLGTPKGFLEFQVKTVAGSLVGQSGEGPSDTGTNVKLMGFFDVTADGQRFRVLRRWSEDQRYLIQISQSQASRQQIFDSVMLSHEGFLYPLLVGFPLLLLPVLFAVYTGLSPLRRLSRELGSRESSDLRSLKVPYVYSELAPVIRELNSTMERLAGLLQRERDFLADAAHELRTPLALISAQCDTLLRAQDADLRDGAARRLLNGVERSSRLVNQLLSLARLDADLEDSLQRTDVADVVRDCLAAHASEAQARRVEIGYVGPDSLVTLCPGHAIESVVNNLVNNAIRYNKANGHVEVRLLKKKNREISLTVLDDGHGIEPIDRAHLFERFRRGTDASASGSGLGLAIVASAARQLGAQIFMTSGMGGTGLNICLTWAELPVQSARTSPVSSSSRTEEH